MNRLCVPSSSGKTLHSRSITRWSRPSDPTIYWTLRSSSVSSQMSQTSRRPCVLSWCACVRFTVRSNHQLRSKPHTYTERGWFHTLCASIQQHRYDSVCVCNARKTIKSHPNVAKGIRGNPQHTVVSLSVCRESFAFIPHASLTHHTHTPIPAPTQSRCCTSRFKHPSTTSDIQCLSQHTLSIVFVRQEASATGVCRKSTRPIWAPLRSMRWWSAQASHPRASMT
jgi:hypothetical protein